MPTQALYLLNSEFYLSQSREIGKAALAAGDTPDAEVDWLYRKILNRSPGATELERANAFVGELGGSSESEPELEQAYSHLAHLLLVSTEFLFLN